MKKLFLLVPSLMVMALGCTEVKKTISAEDLLPEIKTYLAANFAEQKVVSALKEQENLTTSYEVLLDNSLELSFTDKGEIREIESKQEGAVLPDGVIMPNILAYVKTTYPDAAIVAWELEDNENTIELNNKVKLEFDNNGNFKEVDDDNDDDKNDKD